MIDLNHKSDNVLFWYSIASFHQSERRASCDICAPVIALAIHIRDCTIQKFIFSKADTKSSIILIKSSVYQKSIFPCWTNGITRNINYSGLVIFSDSQSCNSYWFSWLTLFLFKMSIKGENHNEFRFMRTRLYQNDNQCKDAKLKRYLSMTSFTHDFTFCSKIHSEYHDFERFYLAGFNYFHRISFLCDYISVFWSLYISD